MIYIIFSGLMIISLFLFLLIELKKSIHLLYVIPVTLGFFTGVYFFYESILGYPTKVVYDTEFQLLSYTVNGEETKIFIWAVFKDEDEPVSMWMPYSREDHQSLEDGKGLIESGRMVEGVIKGSEEGKDGEGPEGEKGRSGGGPRSEGGSIFLEEMNQHKFLQVK